MEFNSANTSISWNGSNMSTENRHRINLRLLGSMNSLVFLASQTVVVN